MQQDLQRLVRELRNETCPRRVHDAVGRRIPAESPTPKWLHPAIPVAIAGLVVACCISAWRWQAGENARPQSRLAERTTLTRIEIANQAESALGLIGSALLNAGTHSEKVISERAVLPLRNSLELTKNKIILNINP